MLMNEAQSAVQVLAVPSGFAFGLDGAASFLSDAAAAGLALSPDFAAAPSPVFGSAFGASSLAARLRFLSPSFLKSVSYQPLPASRNAGAVSRRLMGDAPQTGQTEGSGSDS